MVCNSGVPLKRGQNQKWLHNPSVLGGQQMGGIAAQHVRPWGSREKGTKSEVATEPLPLQSEFMMSHRKKKEKNKVQS